MTTVVPNYRAYGDFALTHSIAHLMADVREKKNLPHSEVMLDAAHVELLRRIGDMKK